MTNRQIETSREIRLWIRDIIVPSIGVGATVLWLHPEIKDNIKSKIDEVKNKFNSKFKKGGK